MSTLMRFAILFTYRLIITFFINLNSEYPDEYWQGPEIAHYIHYHYGYRTWEWTISQPLRNPLYPYLLSLSYYLTPQFLVISGPKIMHAFLTAIGDVYLIKLLEHYFPNICRQKGSFLIFTFVFGCSYGILGVLSRTYFNSFETTLNIIAFYYWVKGFSKEIQFANPFMSADLISRIIVIIGYVSRPTSVILWALIWPYQLLIIYFDSASEQIRARMKLCLKCIGKNLFSILIMFLSSIAVGTIFYGKFTWTQMNFIKYNFIEKWSLFYGQQSYLFYFYASLPYLLGFSLLCFIYSSYQLIFNSQGNSSRKITNAHTDEKTTIYYYTTEENPKLKNPIKLLQLRTLAIICFLYLIISSQSTHKENRFILPIIPFLIVVSCYIFVLLPKKFLYFIVALGLITNSIMILTCSFYGKSGEEILRYTSSKIPSAANNGYELMYLAEGHSLPGLAYIHRNITLTIPDSSPLKKVNKEDEDQLLRRDPLALFKKMTKKHKNLPEMVLVEGRYLRKVEETLKSLKFVKVKKWRFCTIWEEYFIGYNWMVLFQKQGNNLESSQEELDADL